MDEAPTILEATVSGSRTKNGSRSGGSFFLCEHSIWVLLFAVTWSSCARIALLNPELGRIVRHYAVTWCQNIAEEPRGGSTSRDRVAL